MLKCKAVRKDGKAEIIEVPEPKTRKLFLTGISKALNIGRGYPSRRRFLKQGYECITTLKGDILYPYFRKPKKQKGKRRPSKFDRNFLRHRPMPAQRFRSAA